MTQAVVSLAVLGNHLVWTEAHRRWWMGAIYGTAGVGSGWEL